MGAVEVSNLWIEFPVYDAAAKSFRHTMLKRAVGAALSQKGSHMVVSALQDISFTFDKGDRVALIGRNGSGKTTLLRALAGVYKPNRGEIRVSGAVSPMFNMFLGMDADATGYENIKTCGLLWGMSREQIDQKTDDIAEFSELGEYLSMPVRTYSNGMVARLAFSITTANDPEVLLIDEGIGAGDAKFSMKAFARIHEMAHNASLLFIALHATEVLRDLCNKAVWLHGGLMMGAGPFDEVSDARDEWERQIATYERVHATDA